VNYEKIIKKLPTFIEDIINGISIKDVGSYLNYLQAQGMTRLEAIEIIKLFSKNSAKLINLKNN